MKNYYKFSRKQRLKKVLCDVEQGVFGDRRHFFVDSF